MYNKYVYRNGNMYVLDYQHIGLSVMIDNIRTLFENVYKFNSVYISTYDKFIAGLQKIPVNSDNIKHIVLFGNEGPRLPSLLVDPQQIEPDENVSNLFFNFSKFNNVYGNINKVEVLRTDKFIIRLGMSYIKLNVNVQAFLRSVYEKLDLDMKLYQLFTGVNRVSEQFTNIYYVPLPQKLYDDMKLMDQTVEDKVVRIYFDHVGKELPFVIYNYTPRITLQSISDDSEKYGNELVPYFKSSYQLLVEGYVPSMMFLEVNYATDGILFPITTENIYSYLLVDSYVLFNILTNILSDKLPILTNYLISLLVDLGISTEDEINALLSQYTSPSMLNLQLFKLLLDLTYDDLQFITELVTEDVDKLIWLYTNEEIVTKNIDEKLRLLGCNVTQSVKDLPFEQIVLVYRRCSQLLDEDFKKLFLSYVFLRFLQKVIDVTNLNLSVLQLVTIISSNLLQFQNNRDENLKVDEELRNLVIPISKTVSTLYSCKGTKELKNVVIMSDIDIGNYYLLDCTRLFTLDNDSSVTVLGVPYEYDKTSKQLKIFGPLKKGSVVTVAKI